MTHQGDADREEKLLARVTILEFLLFQSHGCIDFLHNCLTNDQYKYEYPESTLRVLAEIKDAVYIHEDYCFHSGHEAGCKSCEYWDTYRQKIATAKEILEQ